MPLADLTGFRKVIIIMSHFQMPLADLTGFRTVIIIMLHFAKNAANFTENMIGTVSKSMLPTSVGTLSVLLFKACCQLYRDYRNQPYTPQHVADFTVITIPTPHSMLLTSQWSLFLLPTACCWLHSDHCSYSPQHVADLNTTSGTPKSMFQTSHFWTVI